MSFIDFIVGATMAAVLGFALFMPSYECSSKAEKQGLEHDWGIIQGCMVKIEGKWIDYDKWRVME